LKVYLAKLLTYYFLPAEYVINNVHALEAFRKRLSIFKKKGTANNGLQATSVTEDEGQLPASANISQTL